MKVYVDFKYLDAEDLPSNISNKYALQVKSINSGAEYKYFDLIDLADYTKQVRKEVIDKVYAVLEQAVPHDLCWSWAVIKKELEQIKGETECQKN